MPSTVDACAAGNSTDGAAAVGRAAQKSTAIGRVLYYRTHGRASISNFIYRALDSDLSTGIVMGAAPA